MLLLLFAISDALAHGQSFGASAISLAPDDVTKAWAVVDGWGVATTSDDGATWVWICEESIGTGTPFDVAAVSGGAAWVAGTDGIALVDSDGIVLASPTVGEGMTPLRIAALGDTALVLATDGEQGGVWACTVAGCVASDLGGVDVLPKSIVVDGDAVWLTTSEGDAAHLYRSTDGAHWTEISRWDAGPGRYVVGAVGELVLVWERPDEPAVVPGLDRSVDGGAHFERVFENGYYTDPEPAMASLAHAGQQWFLGDVYSLRSWRSTDAGETWSEVSLDVPSMRCATSDFTRTWFCSDHLNDGFDVVRTSTGCDWEALSCLQEAATVTTCSGALDAFAEAGAVGGENCDFVQSCPASESSNESRRCGCGSGADRRSGVGQWMVLAIAVVLMRRRTSPASSGGR